MLKAISVKSHVPGVHQTYRIQSRVTIQLVWEVSEANITAYMYLYELEHAFSSKTNIKGIC